MYITKFGHSCLLVEEKGSRILIDPGSYSTMQNDVRDVDAILITHEHQDHMDMRSLKTVLENNPEAKILTNEGAGKMLVREGIAYQKIQDGQSITVKDVLIEAFGRDHALIHSTIPVIRNTGFFIANRFFHPGDAFVYPYTREAPDMFVKDAGATYGRTIAHMPLADYNTQDNPLLHAKVGLPKPIEILALPINAPWMRIAEAMDYAIELKPRMCIPVHDGIWKNSEMLHRLVKHILEPAGIEVRALEIGERVTF